MLRRDTRCINALHHTLYMQHTSGVSSQSVDNPQDATNSTDLYNRPPSLTDYSNPFKFYLSNSLSSLQRYEAGNKTLGLKGSSQALPPLDCLLPPPPTPAALLISLIFNLTWTVINAPPMKGRKTQRIFCSLSLSSTGLLSAIQLSSIFNDFFISGLRRRFVCAFM